MNPLKAIRAKCIDCCCGSSKEVGLCHIDDCALHPFRLGKNPYRRKRKFSEDQKKAMAARLAKSRQKRSDDIGKNLEESGI